MVVTPPKSLFVNFGKDMDKVLQVCIDPSLALHTSDFSATQDIAPSRSWMHLRSQLGPE